MKTFKNFLESKIILEQEAAPPVDAGAAPAADMGMPPMPAGGPDLGGGMGGLGMPPPVGGLGGGGLGGPSLSGGMDPSMGGQPMGSPVAKKLKAYNVWDTLEKILNSK